MSLKDRKLDVEQARALFTRYWTSDVPQAAFEAGSGLSGTALNRLFRRITWTKETADLAHLVTRDRKYRQKQGQM